jgi:KDO2-lipid IV(A) lauroyltransferase
VGPRLKWHKIAHFNLGYVMPALSEPEKQQILGDMWDNLGRVFAEYAFLTTPRLADRIHIDDKSRELLLQAQHKGPVILASGHLANWEILLVMGHRLGLPVQGVYRHINNRVIERYLLSRRRKLTAAMHPKGKRAAAATLRAMKQGGMIGLLVDQKMKPGLEVPFFGKPAQTATAIADLIQKFDVPVIMLHVQRQKGSHFTFHAEYLTLEDHRPEAILHSIHHHLESWIRQAPGQWLWLHQRWGKISELQQR